MSFNFIGKVDITDFKNKVLKLSETSWGENTQRQNYHRALSETQFIPLMWDNQTISRFFYGQKTKYYDILNFENFKKYVELEINSHLNNDGIIYRAILAKVGPNIRIPKHVDQPVADKYRRKIHIPILTNDMVSFTVDGVEKNLKEGEMWQIDFSKLHSVHNKSNQDRIHLIIMYSNDKKVIKKSSDIEMDK